MGSFARIAVQINKFIVDPNAVQRWAQEHPGHEHCGDARALHRRFREAAEQIRISQSSQWSKKSFGAYELRGQTGVFRFKRKLIDKEVDTSSVFTKTTRIENWILVDYTKGKKYVGPDRKEKDP